MKKFLLTAIRFYQRHISPLFPPMCRYYPTCSQYAVQAIEKYGPLRGSFLAAKRLLRCNQFFPGGVDPVPELSGKKNIRKRK
ncbi:MAG: membrane protein insertion efficiency factor YidD [Clostridia bacterium]|nr:membrane protein insertion efficiency factor YidD [Clostridia bacterium]